MKFIPDIGIELKLDIIYFLNSTGIRFDVKKLTPVHPINTDNLACPLGTRINGVPLYLKLWCTAHQIYKNKKKSVCLISNKSQIYLKPCFCMIMINGPRRRRTIAN